MDFSWAENYPDVYRICTLFQMNELSNPIKYCYTPLQPYIQEGPQCGLVVLSMCMGKTNKETVQQIYETAKKLHFSYNGEIFSALDMKKLAEYYLPKTANVQLYENNLNSVEIKDALLQGSFILVPFDSDKTNAPGLEKGHKAHWAIVSGAIQTEEEFYVLARHGKAKNVAIWKLQDLAASNSQLYEFSPDRKLSDVEYKLPEGGICGHLGLNNKSVLISNYELI